MVALAYVSLLNVPLSWYQEEQLGYTFTDAALCCVPGLSLLPDFVTETQEEVHALSISIMVCGGVQSLLGGIGRLEVLTAVSDGDFQ